MEQIPILKVGRCLLVSIQIDMHDKLAMAVQDDLTNKLVDTRARGVLIDISALDLVDSFIGRMLSNIAAMARVRPKRSAIGPQRNEKPQPARNMANSTEPANPIFAGVASIPDLGRSSVSAGARTSA